jgi:D-tagatose-1,6-bisphosphate aldolase subunit GatZ/KbaZ
MRYYWADREIETAVHTLLDNLRARVVPEPVLSAFLPEQYDRIRAGVLSADPKDLVVDRIRGVLRVYAEACGQDKVACRALI